MTDAIEKLLFDQAKELLGANVAGIVDELKTAEGGKLSVTMGFKLAYIGNRVFVNSGVAYSRKFKDESDGMVELPDPNQPRLPLEEPSVTFRTGNTEATVSGEQLSEAVKRVSRKAKEAAAA